MREMTRAHAALSACLGLVSGMAYAELIAPQLVFLRPHVGPLFFVFLRVHPWLVWVMIVSVPLLVSLSLYYLLGVKVEKAAGAWWVVLKGFCLSFSLEFLAINAFSPR